MSVGGEGSGKLIFWNLPTQIWRKPTLLLQCVCRRWRKWQAYLLKSVNTNLEETLPPLHVSVGGEGSGKLIFWNLSTEIWKKASPIYMWLSEVKCVQLRILPEPNLAHGMIRSINLNVSHHLHSNSGCSGKRQVSVGVAKQCLEILVTSNDFT